MNRRLKRSPTTTTRGNRRTRGGAGRHNMSRSSLKGPQAHVRVCLGCERPFRSRGPWNRLCSRCRQRKIEEEDARVYRTPKEWPTSLFDGPDDF